MNYLPLPPPDWKWTDLFLGLFFSLTRKNSIEVLEDTIRRVLGPSHVMATNLGRTALTMGLKALGLSKGSRVILPAIICPTVIRSVLRADCRPILVDVEHNLHLSVRILDACQFDEASVVIVPHIYGLCAPIKEIAKWAEASGLYLVDDAAQAVGISLDEEYLGNYGDFGVLSFGPFKSVSTPRGGALISSSKEIIARGRKNDLPQENFNEALRRIGGGCLKFHYRSYFLSYRNKLSLRKKRAGNSLKTWDRSQSTDETFQMSDLEAWLVRFVLRRIDSIIDRRRKTAYAVWKILNQFDKFDFVGPNNAPYIKIPIRLPENLNAEKAVRYFRAMKIEAERVYSPLHLHKSYRAYAPRPLPSAEEIWETVFLVPNPVTNKTRFGIKRLTEAFNAISKTKVV